MAYKTLGYDNPAYTARLADKFPIAAGAATASSKFVAFANLFLFSLNAVLTTAGTSTYTVGGTATVSSMQLSLIRVTNTASYGATIALATTTYGPFTLGGSFNSGGTGTAQVGGYNAYQINTSTGLAGAGGLPVNQGDQIYFVSGTDATAACTVVMDYQIQPGAAITA
jgi:hypothetical protein